MPVIFVAIVALAAVLALYVAVRALLAGGKETVSVPETILLEEAIVIEPVAPGMEGKAEVRKRGSKPLELRIRATDASQAFVRGTKVRVIDLREGLGIVESADEVHLVR
jgi:membrane protein implicated in regulation of membrane protease activity